MSCSRQKGTRMYDRIGEEGGGCEGKGGEELIAMVDRQGNARDRKQRGGVGMGDGGDGKDGGN